MLARSIAVHPQGPTNVLSWAFRNEMQAFQASKLLPIRVAPQRTTPFVSSSSPAQAASALSRPRSASDDNPTMPSPDPLFEARRRMLWSFGSGLLMMALIGKLQLQHGRASSTGEG